jgi:hypothetical protein
MPFKFAPMGSGLKKLLPVFLVLLLFVPCLNTSVCLANSAEPPSILIIVTNPPEDLEISLGTDDNKAFRVDKKLFESYYVFYSFQMATAGYDVKVTTGNTIFYVALDTSLQKYNNVFTLDLKNQTLTQGETPLRSFSLVSMRVILTLILEAAVFFLFGYRWKKSWIIFLVINLLTQGALNIWLSTYSIPVNSYIILLLFFGEILVLTAEMIGFLLFIKEHRRLRTAFYVLVANLVSLVAGGYLIMMLPV